MPRGGYLGGALAPAVTGFIVQASGSFVPTLMTAAAIGVVCALPYVAILRRPITAADIGDDGPKKNRHTNGLRDRDPIAD